LYRSTHLVEHDSNSLADGDIGQVAVKLALDIAALAVRSHNTAPDDSVSGFLAVHHLCVLGGFVAVSNSLAKVPSAAGLVVDALELHDSLVLVLGLQATAVAGEDTFHVQSSFGHFGFVF